MPRCLLANNAVCLFDFAEAKLSLVDVRIAVCWLASRLIIDCVYVFT